MPHYQPLFQIASVCRKKLAIVVVLFAGFCGMARVKAAGVQSEASAFVKSYCIECHDSDSKKGGLDLTALKLDYADEKVFNVWVKVHDRVRDGEMPPKKVKTRPGADATAAFLKSIARPMVAADLARERAEGRATLRRLNRFEYENTLRDLLDAPWLQISAALPEDGESHRFNKIGDAMDVSHVQMARYLEASDAALRQVIASHASRPPTKTVRYYARQQGAFIGPMKLGPFNRSTERSTFPLLDWTAQPEVLEEKAPVTVGAKEPDVREHEAFGVVASSYEPIELRFEKFKAPAAGHYKLRLCAYTFWAGPVDGKDWWHPDRKKASKGRRSEPVTLYADTPPRLLRLLGSVDVQPEPGVQTLEAWLLAGETIRPDAARLFRSRPPNWHNPLAEKDGQPGVAFRWLEVEGPIYDQRPTRGQKLLCGDLPVREVDGQGEITSAAPKADAERLMRGFLKEAYRRPAEEADVRRFMAVIDSALASGSSFTDAMVAGYSAVLCSPDFVYLREKPGRLDDDALAERLAYFLWNSAPDDELRALASKGELHKPDVLLAQTDRLLAADKSRRFVNAFLDYWLDLRKIDVTAPDASLYGDYYLDDLLTESARLETQLFFDELLRGDLSSRNIVSSDFVMVNERLAALYQLPGVEGVKIRKVMLPPDSVRGGLLTQASVLKVTANGTTTSPVLRGAWVMERILGKTPPRPPPGIAAIDPDTRGATTIREQLDKHRTQASCAACHAKIDPAGFALESFDVFGGFREKYRGLSDTNRMSGYGKGGQPFAFHLAQPVDPGGVLPDGRTFTDVRDLKHLLLSDDRQIARNLVEQLSIYSTGAPIRFGDRPEIEKILDRTAASGYGVKSIIRQIIQSDLFQEK